MPYRNESAIVAWELLNEPHTSDNYEKHRGAACKNQTGGCSPGQLVHSWLLEMSTFVKQLDNHHLVRLLLGVVLHLAMDSIIIAHLLPTPQRQSRQSLLQRWPELLHRYKRDGKQPKWDHNWESMVVPGQHRGGGLQGRWECGSSSQQLA